jgi:hypothetical protein
VSEPRVGVDIIAVRADPLTDVRSLAGGGFVMKGGDVYRE